jgi:cobalamin biosynthesis Mg chelatase CobN
MLSGSSKKSTHDGDEHHAEHAEQEEHDEPEESKEQAQEEPPKDEESPKDDEENPAETSKGESSAKDESKQGNPNAAQKSGQTGGKVTPPPADNSSLAENTEDKKEAHEQYKDIVGPTSVLIGSLLATALEVLIY